MLNPVNDNNNEVKLGYRERDKLFKKKYNELKIKVYLNCFELIALLAVIFLVTHQLSSYLANFSSSATHYIIASCISIPLVLIFYRIKKYQITITRFDKEDIYKKISADLLKKKGNQRTSKSDKKELIAS